MNIKILLLTLMILSVTACGQSGKLYLPKPEKPVVISAPATTPPTDEEPPATEPKPPAQP